MGVWVGGGWVGGWVAHRIIGTAQRSFALAKGPGLVNNSYGYGNIELIVVYCNDSQFGTSGHWSLDTEETNLIFSLSSLSSLR